MKIYENLDLQYLKNEIWKNIKDYLNYQVSNFGRIKSFKQDKINGIIRKQYKDKDNYSIIRMCQNGESKHKKVHILVFETFNNYKLKDSECIHHKDENKENNYYENLEKINKSKHSKNHNQGKHHSEESKRKMSKNHADFKGENSSSHKLLNHDIYDIRKSLELKLYTVKQLSWMFDISAAQIYRIKNRENWKETDND